MLQSPLASALSHTSGEFLKSADNQSLHVALRRKVTRVTIQIFELVLKKKKPQVAHSDLLSFHYKFFTINSKHVPC